LSAWGYCQVSSYSRFQITELNGKFKHLAAQICCLAQQLVGGSGVLTPEDDQRIMDQISAILDELGLIMKAIKELKEVDQLPVDSTLGE
jgi:hypothetical protein